MGRVVVIGLDGATSAVIRPMLEGGRLRNLSRIATSGAQGSLESVVPTNSAAAWNSFATGMNPGRHGVFDFVKRVPGTYRYVPVTSLDRRAKTVWGYASDAGLSSCVVNVPLTYPPEAIEGVMISGFPYPEKRRDYAQPAAALDELEADLGTLRLLKPSPHFMRPGTQKELLAELVTLTERQADVLVRLIRREDWRLVVTVFDATDVAGHFFWRYIDRDNPRYDPAEAEELGGCLYDAYEAVDGAIGKVLGTLGPEDNVLVVSDHGFGPSRHSFNVNGWLLSKGYIRLKRSPGPRLRKALHGAGITTDSLFRTARRAGLAGPRTHGDSTTSRRLRLANLLTLSLQDVDWLRTSAYSLNKGGHFYINRRGREPQGVVQPGADAERLEKELVEAVSGVRDPATGLVLFDLVSPGSALFEGPYADQAPDVIFSDTRNGYGSYSLFDFGGRELITDQKTTSGGHRLDGVLLASGPDIASGRLITGAKLVDLGPTILHMMGLPIPSDVDGRVLCEVFASGSPLNAEVRRFHAGLAEEARRWARGAVASGSHL